MHPDRRLVELIERRIKTDKESFNKLFADKPTARIVPGVEMVVATTFAATLDDSSRFPGGKHVRSYLGLVPREHSSGERQRRERVGKAGSMRARSLLVEAALVRDETGAKRM